MFELEHVPQQINILCEVHVNLKEGMGVSPEDMAQIVWFL